MHANTNGVNGFLYCSLSEHSGAKLINRAEQIRRLLATIPKISIKMKEKWRQILRSMNPQWVVVLGCEINQLGGAQAGPGRTAAKNGRLGMASGPPGPAAWGGPLLSV
jgi:hypothetical protein